MGPNQPYPGNSVVAFWLPGERFILQPVEGSHSEGGGLLRHQADGQQGHQKMDWM